MTKKNILSIVIVILLFLFAGIAIFFLDLNCLFKMIFRIPCPGCGMSRAFKAIVNFKIIESFSYNILAIPVLLLFIYMLFLTFKDIIKKENNLYTFVINLFTKHYKLIIFLLVLSEVLNIIRDI
ncbi:MAG: DUF2752 domain-containing protein [Bacilli bacterium]